MHHPGTIIGGGKTIFQQPGMFQFTMMMEIQ
jgi:hypothetical protein